MTTSMGCD